jgi:hypothetical protein
VWILSEEEVNELREWCAKYGSGNCWTGTSGRIALLIMKILKESEQ